MSKLQTSHPGMEEPVSNGGQAHPTQAPRVKQLVKEGIIRDPVMVQLCMGVPWGAPDDLNTFMAMVNNVPQGWTWSAFSLGRDQMPYVAAAVLAGGNVRVGLEDNLWLDKGVLARNEDLVERAVGIIGSRHCTTYGASLARSFARDLAQQGWWIVSGLARGIDTAAHEGALDAAGRTAAVVGHGLDLTFPPEAIRLRARMKADGCVLSEFPLGRPADRQTFPQRNRIVAGLVRVMVVVETDVGGGSMITARFAGDVGRTLCAVPGRADSPASRGCHALIRDGATLVSSVDDILTELGESRGQPALALVTDPPEFARWLPHFAGGTAQDAESLAALADCAIAEAAVSLTMMEIRGVLTRRPDGRHERA